MLLRFHYTFQWFEPIWQTGFQGRGQALGREALASHIKADDERRGQDGPERHLQNTKGTVQFGNAFHEPFCAGANTGNAAIEQGRR